MIRLAVFGADGRMGRRVVALSSVDKRFKLVSAVEKEDNPNLGKDAGLIAGIGEIGVRMDTTAKDFDVLIDFSVPDAIFRAIDLCVKNSSALVSGVTGLGEKEFDALREASKKIGVFHASNFSKGVASLALVVKDLANRLPDADIEIVEAHHRGKSDSPSGTAISLGKTISESRGTDFEKSVLYGRHGKFEKREKEEIGIHSLRAGGIIGEHAIYFSLPYETIIVEHRAISRDLFVAGALDSAEFIFGKIGFFSMNDLLKKI